MRRLALFVAAVALTGCGGGQETAAPSGVRELTNVLDLRSDFEADAGKTRVVLLFSPT